MNASLPTVRDWKNALPHIERMLTQTLEVIERKLNTAPADVATAPLDNYEERLAAVLNERLHGFEALGQRACDHLQKLDAELAADEDRLRTQLNDMQAFRQNLAQWLESLIK